MKFIYGKNDLKTLERAEENCYLITNGLGGFSSLTIAGSSARCDHALFMAAMTAPNKRYQLLANTMELLVADGKEYNLSSQRFADNKELSGYRYLDGFSYEYLPEYTFRAGSVEIIKTITMKHGENTLGISYKVINHGEEAVQLKVVPLLHFSGKGCMPRETQQYELNTKENIITSEGLSLMFKTDGAVTAYKQRKLCDMYYEYDARDGRNSEGMAFYNHEIVFEGSGEHYIIYGTENVDYDISSLIHEEKERQKGLVNKAGLKNDTAKCLVRAADAYVAERASTGGRTILAGFPLFEDWGRDTMIAVTGCAIVTRQLDTARSILRTFMKYCHKGIMPNLFPEGKDSPMYNTVDASLLFINAVYEYYRISGDTAFVREAITTINDIISWYMKGTDYSIGMDEDGLIMAGSDLWQLTWMDVRVNDILPTPRHGKPVEINAYWYNALMIADELYGLAELKDVERLTNYKALADKVKASFMEKFWNEDENCLKDLVSGTCADYQVRCNQIWAASMPYSMLDERKAHAVIRKVYEELYTPVGLRSLSYKDKEFHGFYGGSMEERDMAYHQGTVWAFPLGGYYLARYKWAEDKALAREEIYRQLEGIEAALKEGCIGHIAEIFDGLNPTVSKGCFAQAWSVGEILRVYAMLEGK